MMNKKPYLTLLALAAVTVAGAQVDNTPQRLLAEQRIFGDVLGEVNTNTCTGQKKYFYGVDGKLSRVVNEKRGNSREPFLTTDYFRYNYADGRLTDVEQWQYTVGEGEQWLMKRSATGNIVYTYDENGNCVKEDDGGIVTLHEYNADGFCTKTVEGSGRTVVYDEFNADGKPLHAIVRPARPQNLGDSYEAIYTYDADGHLVSIYRQHDEDLKVETGRIGNFIMYDEAYAGDFISEETWTYNNGVVTAHTLYEIDYSGLDVKAPTSRTVYKYAGNDAEIVNYYEEYYDSWTRKWTKNTLIAFEDEYGYSSNATACDVEEARVVEDGSVQLTVSVPYGSDAAPIVVYRNGERIAPELVSKDDDGKLTLTDSFAKAGDNEYFVVLEGSMVVGKWLSVNTSEVVPELLLGDANNDGEINVFDVVAISEYILNADAPLNKDAADYNHDGNIDVYDVVGVAAEILAE